MARPLLCALFPQLGRFVQPLVGRVRGPARGARGRAVRRGMGRRARRSLIDIAERFGRRLHRAGRSRRARTPQPHARRARAPGDGRARHRPAPGAPGSSPDRTSVARARPLLRGPEPELVPVEVRERPPMITLPAYRRKLRPRARPRDRRRSAMLRTPGRSGAAASTGARERTHAPTRISPNPHDDSFALVRLRSCAWQAPRLTASPGRGGRPRPQLPRQVAARANASPDCQTRSVSASTWTAPEHAELLARRPRSPAPRSHRGARRPPRRPTRARRRRPCPRSWSRRASLAGDDELDAVASPRRARPLARRRRSPARGARRSRRARRRARRRHPRPRARVTSTPVRSR